MKLTPRSIARCKAASEVVSSVLPQASPPIPHAPNPISEIFQPVLPSGRYSIVVSSPFLFSTRQDYGVGFYGNSVWHEGRILQSLPGRGLAPALVDQRGQIVL